ncbi:murein hydrolase activator EnvC family protein [Phycicoccus sonneratiae]|uniref:M23 family metallopeptidase n=1 Tax=Phycicoccus sonneratiae TaxID=2807628 RepID=A0ABS2CKL0_9MICO|nr:M23 family metallopeptidase [Phycicoccus sonneraticus]MBM6400422.1 M23 family metallopeptidase [Phycicoccus sonneraticus]
MTGPRLLPALAALAAVGLAGPWVALDARGSGGGLLLAGPAAPSAAAPRAGPGWSRPPPSPAARWRWPLAPVPRVVRPFDAPLSSWGRGHRGLDLAAAPGAVVRAVEAGTVTHAGVVAGRGTVTVTHSDGLRSTYEPVAASVGAGTAVAAGDVLGTLERSAGSHCGSAACLHLGARRGVGYLDPLPLLTGGGRVRLLPTGPGP